VPDDDHGRVERALYLVAAWTGLRQGELVALKWQNVDFASIQIRVHESFSDGYLTDPKSFRSIRAVPKRSRRCSHASATGRTGRVTRASCSHIRTRATTPRPSG
jgi:hypothetical protein